MTDRVARILSFLGLSRTKEPSTKDDNDLITEVIQEFNALHLLGGAETKPEYAEVNAWLILSKSLTKEDLAKIETALYMRSYLVGQAFTVADASIFESIKDKYTASVADYPELSRWFDHIQRTCQSTDIETLPLGSTVNHFMSLPSSSNTPASTVSAQKVATLQEKVEKVGVDVNAASVVVEVPVEAAAATTAPAAAPAAPAEVGVEGGVKKEKKEKKEKKIDETTPATTTTAATTTTTTAVAAGAVGEENDLDPSKLDIRVGIVVKCWNHPDSDKLLCEEINVGESVVRTIASGIRPHYAAEDLVNRKVCVLANLKDRNLAGFKSQGMVLCAVSADHTIIKLLQAPADSNAGDRITFPGFSGEPASSAQMAKKKILEKLASGLRTDSAGVAHWGQCPFTVESGVCVAHDFLADAVVS